MANVLIVAYLLIVLALIATILLQRSEGGALGGLGGGSGGGIVSARGSANLLSRTTAILAALFMSTAIALSIVADIDRGTDSILDSASQGQTQNSVLDALNALQLESSADNSLSIPDATSDQSTAPTTDSSPDLPVPEAPTSETSN